MTYEYTTRWFPEFTQPLWERYLLPERAKINAYLEIGVHEGQSLIWACEHLEPAIVDGIDQYKAPRRRMQPEYNAAKALAVRNIQAYQEKHRPAYSQIHLFTDMPSQVWLRNQEPIPTYDMIFCDGCHLAREALEDFVLSWPLLKQGGIMILDDYNRRWQMGGPRSHEAIDAFLHGYETLYEYIYREPRQIAIRKR